MKSAVKIFHISVVALLVGLWSGQIVLAAMPDVNGTWKPLSADDRLMTIKLLKGKITIKARELSCTLSDLQSEANDLSMTPSVTANSVCYAESAIVYTKETLTTLQVGRDVF
jgi:hypothetical protein